MTAAVMCGRVLGPVGTRNGLSVNDSPARMRVVAVAWKAAPGRASFCAVVATGLRLGATGRLTGLVAPFSSLARRTGLLLPVLMASPSLLHRATLMDFSFQLATSAW